MSKMSATMLGQKRNEQIDKITELARQVLRSGDKCATWFYDLERKNGKRWAIVFAWMDYDNNDDWRVYGKVAYQPTNSIMQCDYDIDWSMPITDDGEVDDTECDFGYTSIRKAEIAELYGEWERIRKEYVDYEEE